MNDLVIFGAGYPDVIKLVSAINRAAPIWRMLGFIDELKAGKDADHMGIPIIGGAEKIAELNKAGVYIFNNVFSSCANRAKVTEKLSKSGARFASLIHPSVDLDHVSYGSGVMIMAGVQVGINTEIGDQTTLRANCFVSHEVRIGRNVFVGAGALVSGKVTIGDNVYIAVGSVIRDNVLIGENSFVGAGAVVVSNVLPGTTVAGVPAKPLEARHEE